MILLILFLLADIQHDDDETQDYQCHYWHIDHHILSGVGAQQHFQAPVIPKRMEHQQLRVGNDGSPGFHLLGALIAYSHILHIVIGPTKSSHDEGQLQWQIVPLCFLMCCFYAFGAIQIGDDPVYGDPESSRFEPASFLRRWQSRQRVYFNKQGVLLQII